MRLGSAFLFAKFFFRLGWTKAWLVRLFFSPSQVRFVELSDNAKILPKCRETWLVLFSATGKAEKFVKVSTGLTNFVSTFLRKKKFPSQSSLAHKLMCSGFFYLPKVSEKLPQPGCISIRLMYSGFFYLPPFKMIFNIKERKKVSKQKRIANSTQCSQAVTHPSTD